MNRSCQFAIVFLPGLVALAIMLSACALIGQETTTRKVDLETINGETASGILSGIDNSGRVTLEDGRAWPLADLLSVAMSPAPVAKTVRGVQVYLVDGGLLNGTAATFDGERLPIAGAAVRAELPPELVRAIIWKADPAVALARDNPRSDSDRVVVAGEAQPVTIDGIVESWDGERLKIEYEGQSRSIQADKVLGVVFADLGRSPAAGLQVEAHFADGSRIVGALDSLTNQDLIVNVRGVPIAADPAQLSRLEIRTDRLRYVADLETLEVEHKPIFAPQRGYQRNRSVEGNPLRLTMADGSVQTFSRGLGVAAYSKVTLTNAGNFNRLAGWVGIDAETEGRGNCRILIVGDSILLLDRQLIGGRPAESFTVDISGISRIELIVEPGELFDLSDHVSWGNLRLLKVD